MRPWVAIVLLLAIGVAGAQAPAGVVRDVGLEHFQPVVFAPEDLVGGCDADGEGGGDFERSSDGRRIRFFERPVSQNASGLPLLPYEDGYGSTGCGTARVPIDIPNGTESIQVRFAGDRQVVSADVTSDAPLVQEVRLRHPGGTLASQEVFAADAGSHEMDEIVISPFLVGDAGPAEVEWYFEDEGFDAIGQEAANPLSGQDFSAVVQDATIAFVGSASDLSEVTARDSREGTQLTKEHRVDVTIADVSPDVVPAVHVRVVPGLGLDRVLAPDGTDLGAPQTYDGQGVLGRDQTHIVFVVGDAGVTAVLPAPLVAAHGEGAYRFIFVERSGIDVSPALQPMSYVLLATPLPFAVIAWLEARTFRQEAFGGYSRTARNLQRGVVLVSLYYVAVVASAIVGGRTALMAVWPMPLEGVLLYVQVGLAVVAFTALWLVAREMLRMVHPRDESASVA